MAISLTPEPAAPQAPTKRKPVPPTAVPAPPVGAAAPSVSLAPAPPAAAPTAAPMTAPAPAPLPVTAPAPTVAPPPTPANRIELATKAFENIQKAREPADQRAREAITSQAAGLGQLGAGQWRSALATAENERQLQLDVARDELINKATEGAIADASTAYQQALAGSQLGLAAELGRANVDIGKGQLDLAKTGQEGSQALEKERIDLAREGQTGSLGLERERLAQSGSQFAQSLDFQKEQAAIEAAYRNGTLTIAQRDQALRELQNQQQFGLEGQRLELARTGQEASIGAEDRRIALAARQQELDEAYRAGQITLAERDQALRELESERSFGLSGEQLGLERERLAQGGEQFEQSLAFQKERAEIDDAYRTGTLTLAQRDQALRELQNEQQFGLAGEQIQLAKDQFALTKKLGLENLSLDQARAALDEKVRTGQLSLAEKDQALRELQNQQAETRADEQIQLARDESLGRVQTGVDEDGNPVYEESQAAKQSAAQLALQQKALELDERVRTGQMTLAEKELALRELSQAQGNENEQARIQLAKDQMAQTAEQFGATQQQQMELAKLADATANRQIDVSTAQGKNALLLELARIMGGPAGNIDPTFFKAMAAALGLPLTGTGTTTSPGAGETGTTATGGSGGPRQKTEGYGE